MPWKNDIKVFCRRKRTANSKENLCKARIAQSDKRLFLDHYEPTQNAFPNKRVDPLPKDFRKIFKKIFETIGTDCFLTSEFPATICTADRYLSQAKWLPILAPPLRERHVFRLDFARILSTLFLRLQA